MNHPNWNADRLSYLDPSGIRKVFDLAKNLKNPINLSIGQPDFQVPEKIRQKAVDAIQNHFNGYTVTQGIDAARDALKIREGIQHLIDRELILTSGTSGGLVLALLATINPGDEVIIFDPWFALYPNMIRLAGGTPVAVDTYPEFDLPIERIPRSRWNRLPKWPTKGEYSSSVMKSIPHSPMKRSLFLRFAITRTHWWFRALGKVMGSRVGEWGLPMGPRM